MSGWRRERGSVRTSHTSNGSELLASVRAGAVPCHRGGEAQPVGRFGLRRAQVAQQTVEADHDAVTAEHGLHGHAEVCAWRSDDRVQGRAVSGQHAVLAHRVAMLACAAQVGHGVPASVAVRYDVVVLGRGDGAARHAEPAPVAVCGDDLRSDAWIYGLSSHALPFSRWVSIHRSRPVRRT
jgi:hypothetical protein